jgi:hypothetical protein
LCIGVLQVFAPFMYKTVLHVLHTSFDDPTAPLPQRLAQHHELYDEMRQRCQDFLDGHPQQQQLHAQQQQQQSACDGGGSFGAAPRAI